MSHKDPLVRRAYDNRYQNARRRLWKTLRRCVDCGHRLGRRRVGRTGWVLSRCPGCIERHAKHTAACERRRQRALRNTSRQAAASTGPDARVQAVWTAWKQKLNAPCGRIIDALLVHGEMNTTQLSVAAQMHKSNVSKAIQKLHEVSVITKNGGRFSLKAL
jgi:hypothetical protein